MLVLSRKLKEKIVLPTVRTAIQVVEIKGGVVRLGIEAPPEVTILREEVVGRAAEWKREEAPPPSRTAVNGSCGPLTGPMLRRLKFTGMGLGLLRLHLDAGSMENARALLAALQEDFQLLLHGVEGCLEGSAPQKPAAAAKQQKALLVEDDRTQRDLLAGFLRRSGLEVATAGDGADALDYLRSHGKPDVVLLDMGLPRVDGPTMVREVRRNPAYAGLKIFAVTAHRPEEYDLGSGPTGVDGWFQKPLDPQELLQDLQEELDLRLCKV